MKYYLFLLLFIFLNCAMLKKGIDKDIDVQILNKTIKLPLDDQTTCVDTIFIQLRNNSNYEYLFDIDTTAFYFYNTGGENKFIDPFGGFGCGFLDKNGNYLEVFGDSVFNPEGFENEEDFMTNKFAMSLALKSMILYKVPLVFPSEITFKSFIQKVPNINKAKLIEIFFRPTNNYLNHLVKEGTIKLNRNQRIMNFYEKFMIPVKIECL